MDTIRNKHGSPLYDVKYQFFPGGRAHFKRLRGTPREREVRGASGSTKGAGKDLSMPMAGETFAFRMTRAAYYGTYPVYDLQIDADGSLRFEGTRYVRVRGKQSATIPAADVAALVGKGRKRTLVDYLGNGCIPASLRTLAEEVDRIARTDAWTKCEKRPNPPFPDADWCER